MRISDWSSDVCSSDLDVDRTIRFGFCETHPAPFPSSRPQPASGVPFRLASVLALAVEADAEEFEAMVDEAIAQGAGDFSLQPPDLLVGEFHHLARLHVDGVVVLLFRPLLLARPALPEVRPLPDARHLEQLH